MSLKKLNRRLTGSDAFFFYVERAPQCNMNIGICHLYEGHISREEVVRSLSDRMHLLPRYRQKAVFPPLRLAHPTWEDDPTFDVRNHVEEVILPPPVDDRVLSRESGRLIKPRMDYNRPLWRLILLQGRPDGNTAILWEIHHAVIDGMSAVELIHVMHDQKPNAAPPPPPTVPWQPRPVPDKLTLLQEAVRTQLTETVGWLTDQVFSLFRPQQKVKDIRHMFSSVAKALRALKSAPRSPFTHTTLSGERETAWADFSLAEIRAVRSALGGTLNDVVLALIAGGMGRYMRAHGYQTDGVELLTLCPVSLRKEDERGLLGNLIAAVTPPLYVGITDPVQRLTAEREAMERIKQEDHAGTVNEVVALADRIPPALQRFTVPLSLKMLGPRLGTACSNVPGPQIPLYLAGHKMLHFFVVAPMAPGIPLFNAILSYNRQLTISATVDPKLIPDAWFYTDCLKESFAELRAAAEQTAQPLPAVVQEPMAAA